MVEVLKPKTLVPIHTFEGDEYQGRLAFIGHTMQLYNRLTYLVGFNVSLTNCHDVC